MNIQCEADVGDQRPLSSWRHVASIAPKCRQNVRMVETDHCCDRGRYGSRSSSRGGADGVRCLAESALHRKSPFQRFQRPIDLISRRVCLLFQFVRVGGCRSGVHEGLLDSTSLSLTSERMDRRGSSESGRSLRTATTMTTTPATVAPPPISRAASQGATTLLKPRIAAATNASSPAKTTAPPAATPAAADRILSRV